MISFHHVNDTDYAQALRIFLNEPEEGFYVRAGLVEPGRRKPGPVKFNQEALEQLEQRANEKAARAESNDTTFGERLQLALSYWEDVYELAYNAGLNESLLEKWTQMPSAPIGDELDALSALASEMELSIEWLISGDAKELPADSYIGQRVGNEALGLRAQVSAAIKGEITKDEALYEYSISSKKEANKLMEAQARLERLIFSNKKIAKIARQAGGRLQFCQMPDGSQEESFIIWWGRPDTGLSARRWSDEIERIIESELKRAPTIHAAWERIDMRCQQAGIEKYPSRVALYKRAERTRELNARFGVEGANEQIEKALALASDAKPL